MSVGPQRAIGATFGFAFAAVWVTTGVTAAVACAVAAGLGYGVVRLRERGGLSGIVVTRDAVRRELHGRVASPPRSVRSPKRPQQARRPMREPAAAPAVAEPATYGW